MSPTRTPGARQSRANRIAQAMGYASDYVRRQRAKAAPKEVARKRAGLDRRYGGSIRGKDVQPAPQSQRPKQIVDTPGQTTVDTTRFDVMRHQLQRAAKTNRRVSVTVTFATAKRYKRPAAEEHAEVPMFDKGGWSSLELQDRINNPEPGDPWAPGDVWGAMTELANRSPGIENASGVERARFQYWD